MLVRFRALTVVMVMAVVLAGCNGETSGGVEDGVASILVQEAYAFTPPLDTLGAYMEVQNDGRVEDTLLSATAPGFGDVQVHDTVMEDGTARMIEQTDGVVIPAGETVSFAPGGLHIMLIGAEDEITAGVEIPVTLTFEHVGEVDVTVVVRDRGEGDPEPMGMDHSGHMQGEDSEMNDHDHEEMSGDEHEEHEHEERGGE